MFRPIASYPDLYVLWFNGQKARCALKKQVEQGILVLPAFRLPAGCGAYAGRSVPIAISVRAGLAVEMFAG